MVVIPYISGLKVAYLQDVSGLTQSRSQYHVALYPCLLLPGTCIVIARAVHVYSFMSTFLVSFEFLFVYTTKNPSLFLLKLYSKKKVPK